MKVRPRRLENPFHVLEGPLGLLADVATQEFVRLWIERDLPRDEQKAAGLDGLRVRPNGFGTAIGEDDILHGSISLEEVTAGAASFAYRARNSCGIPGCFSHRRTNAAAFWRVSASSAAIRSSRLKPRWRRA